MLLSIAAVSALLSTFPGQCDPAGVVTYQPPIRYAVPPDLPPFLADINSDGLADLVGIVDVPPTGVPRSIYWRLNQGSGVFGPRVGLNTGVALTAGVAVQDADGDGRNDILAASADETSTTHHTVLSFLYADEHGGFLPSTAPIDLGEGYRGVMIIDLNGDGIPDLVSMGSSWNVHPASLRFYPGLGGRRFGAPVETILPEDPYSARFEDYNGDRIVDLTISCQINTPNRAVAFLRGRGDGTFDAPRLFPTGPQAFEHAVGDVNGDGRLDIVTGGYEPVILLGDGLGGFGAPTALGMSSEGGAPFIGDVNGDGVADIVTATTGALKVRLGLGAGIFSPPFEVYREMISWEWRIDGVGDLNGDHRPDFVGLGRVFLSSVSPRSPSVVGLAPYVPADPVVGDIAEISVFGDGSVPLSYQWLKDGLPLANGSFIEGATTTHLQLHWLRVSDAGTYSARISNACGQVVSAPVVITVRDCAHRTTAPCPIDIDDGSGTGTPDGGVTIEDLVYVLFLFSQGSLDADFDNGSGAGCLDGIVDLSDLFYFLEHWSAGC